MPLPKEARRAGLPFGAGLTGSWRDDSDAGYRTLFTCAPIAMHLLDEDKCIVDVNDQWLDLFGYAREEVIGFPVQRFQEPQSAARMEADWALAVSQRVARERERRFICKTGKVLDIMLSCTIETFPDDTLRSICALTDVTDRKRAQTALRESEERFRSAMLHSAIGMALVAPDGHWLQVNAALCQITGYSANELMNLTFQDITHPEDLDADLAHATALLNGEITSYTMEKRYIRKDGAVVWIQLTGSLVRDAAGRPLYFIGQVQNIQERRRAEAALHESEARLRQAEKMAALGELAGGIAHDFNNVLQTVHGGAGLIRSHATDAARVQRFAGMIENAAQRGSSITRRLLAFARCDALNAEVVHVPALLEDLREMLALGAAITVSVDTGNAVPPVLVDRGQLESVLVNLAANARDAMPEGGTLTFSATSETFPDGSDNGALRPGAYIRLSVADTGTGMAPEALARASEPFFTTKAAGKGTGLGLSMARGFAEQSGGALTITSEIDQGTVVTLWLPVAPPEAEARAKPAGETALPPARLPHRILLVEDEVLVRQVLSEQLALRGFHVIEAGGPAAALEILHAGPQVDLVISDQVMHEMDGASFLRTVWSRHAGLPAILLTGHMGEGTALAAQSTGGRFRVVRKPVTGEQLASCIASLTEMQNLS